jgi:hypothetical protein
MSLATCGQAAAEGADCGHAVPAAIARLVIATTISERVARSGDCIDVLMLNGAQYKC